MAGMRTARSRSTAARSSTRAEKPFAAIGSVSANYFRTLGIPLIQGRTFTEQDREPAPEVAIVNTTLVRKYLGGKEAVGARVRFGDPTEGWITIVGVVADSTELGLGKAPAPLVYMPVSPLPTAVHESCNPEHRGSRR